MDEEFLIQYDESEEETLTIERKYIPIETIDSIYCFGELRFNSKFFNFLSQNNIPLHLFNYYGFYSGTFYPRETQASGKLLISQVSSYLDERKRLEIAKEFIRGAVHNIIKNLEYYNNREKELAEYIQYAKEAKYRIEEAKTIEELMGIEGGTRKKYYESWKIIINQQIDFEKREKRPPTNSANALISFRNSLLYTTVLSEIYRNQLNPTISYLQSPGERRFSLCLDISEVFKPLIVDRLIFSILNKKIIKESSFNFRFNSCLLNDDGKKIFIKEYDEKLSTTIKHRKLNRNVLYQTLIRYECYKLIKHLLGDQEYKSFKIWR